MTKVQSIAKLSTPIEKKTRTVVDTIDINPAKINSWMLPPFQRPLKENDKVRALAEELKDNGGVMPGIITLGVLDGQTYILDGQHRRGAFILSGLKEGYSDIRIHYCSSMAEMGEEFVKLNSQLVRMKPDDILRGLEPSIGSLSNIRKRCPWVGYDQIRRGGNSPILSMAMLMRTWAGSGNDVPRTPSGVTATALAQQMSDGETNQLCEFLELAVQAFGKDPEYQRLWGGLNLILCMWLYRRTVISQYSIKTPKVTKDQFRKCLMSLSANTNYIEWLLGRQAGERDRAPAYGKIKAMFSARLQEDTGKKAYLPMPSWATHA